MKYAQIRNGKVFHVADYDKAPDFHPKIVMVECGDSVAQGDLYDGESFSKPPLDVPPRPVTRWVKFVEMLGEDAYDTLMNSPNKRAKWIREIWKGNEVIDPNNQPEFDTLGIMRDANLITLEQYNTLIGI